jgi:hypothetical protein
MNALEIIGKAALFPDFRRTLFADVESVIAQNRADLPQREEDCLRRIVKATCPNRDGARATPEDNGLQDALDAVGKAVSKMCPQEPCEWP